MAQRNRNATPLLLVVVTLAAGVIVVALVEWLSVFAGIALAIGASLLMGEWLIAGFRDEGIARSVRRSFYVGLVLRVMTAMVFYWILNLVAWKGRPGFCFDDEPHYDLVARVVAQSPFSPTTLGSLGKHFLYEYLSGLVYFAFGHYPLLIRMMGGACAAVMVPLVGRLALHAGRDGQQAAQLVKVSVWLTALSPELVLWSVSQLREWLIALIVAFIIFLLLELRSHPRNPVLVAGLCACFVCLFDLRVATLLVILCVVGLQLGWQLLRLQGRLYLTLQTAILLGFVLVLVSVVLQDAGTPGNLAEWEDYLLERYMLNSRAVERREAAISGANTSWDRSGIAAYSGLLGWSVTAMRSILNPSPLWLLTVSDMNAVVFFLPGLLWYALLPVLAIGVLLDIRRWNSDAKLIGWVFAAVFLASVSPVGLALNSIRFRVQVLPLMYIVAAQGILSLQARPSLRRKLTVVVILAYLGLLLFYGFGSALPWSLTHPFSLAAMAGLGGLTVGVALLGKRLSTRKV